MDEVTRARLDAQNQMGTPDATRRPEHPLHQASIATEANQFPASTKFRQTTKVAGNEFRFIIITVLVLMSSLFLKDAIERLIAAYIFFAVDPVLYADAAARRRPSWVMLIIASIFVVVTVAITVGWPATAA